MSGYHAARMALDDLRKNNRPEYKKSEGRSSLGFSLQLVYASARSPRRTNNMNTNAIASAIGAMRKITP